ncbi:MAG: bifunctional diguanylate cyclase/phosphodiesterase [Microthrixaceae bacterium]
MSRRLRRRIEQLEKSAASAYALATEQRAAIIAETAVAEKARLDAERAKHVEALDNLRLAYDEALGEAGVVLFQQTSSGADSFHVSSSVSQVLGWEPAVFLNEGILRGMVHPDDLAALDRALAVGVDEERDELLLDEMSVIDLTSGAASPLLRTAGNSPISPKASIPSGSEVTLRFRTSSDRWRKILVRPIADSSGALVSGSLIDLTDYESRDATITRFAELVEHDPAGCLILEFRDSSDPNTLVVRAMNTSARRMLNLDRESAVDVSLDGLFAGSSAQLVRSALFDVYHTGESMTAERLSFNEIPGTYLDLRVDRLSDGALGMSIEDVTSTVAIETRLRRQASHDALTGLPNRSLLEERLSVAVDRVEPGAPIALALIDIDGLRNINEDYGIHAGDELLVQVGRRLVQGVRGISIVSRLGEDEFAVLTRPCSSHAEAVSYASAIRSELSRPFDVAGHLLEPVFSIGVALAPEHGDDWRTLLRNATIALSNDKSVARAGSGAGAGGVEASLAERQAFTVFRRSDDSSSIRRLAVLSELRQSLANNELELRFQPQIDLRTGKVTKVEAVPRWLNDDDPSRMSVELLELAEQSGLIQPLTRWALTEAARAAETLARQRNVNPFGPTEPLVISLNVSSHNLFDPDLSTFIELLIRSGELQPDLVELEVSETGLMDDPAGSLEILSHLSGLGVKFIVDEFGTGYTSLSTMQHLPVAGLKIDGSYVSTISTAASDAAIVRSTIELSHELGLSVGAEGVSDAATLAQLAEFGCDFAQGTYLSGPTSLDQLGTRIVELESAVRGWLGTSTAAR